MKNIKSINSFLKEEQDIIDDLGDLGFKSLKGWVFMMTIGNALECLYIIAENEEHAANLLWTMNEDDQISKDDEHYESDLTIEDAISILKETFQDGSNSYQAVFKMLKWWDGLKPTPAYRNKATREYVGVNSKGYYNPIKAGDELKPVFSNSSIILDK